MRGGKNGRVKKQIGVNRAVLGRFGYFRPPDRVRHASLIIFHRSNAKSIDWEPILGPNTFFVAPNRPCRKRHWFPADGIGCLPFWSGRFFLRSCACVAISADTICPDSMHMFPSFFVWLGGCVVMCMGFL